MGCPRAAPCELLASTPRRPLPLSGPHCCRPATIAATSSSQSDPLSWILSVRSSQLDPLSRILSVGSSQSGSFKCSLLPCPHSAPNSSGQEVDMIGYGSLATQDLASRGSYWGMILVYGQNPSRLRIARTAGSLSSWRLAWLPRRAKLQAVRNPLTLFCMQSSEGTRMIVVEWRGRQGVGRLGGLQPVLCPNAPIPRHCPPVGPTRRVLRMRPRDCDATPALGTTQTAHKD